MPTLDILWPTFALVALTFVIWASMGVTRMRHVRRTPPGRDDFATNAAMQRYFAPVALVGDNYANLLQMPVLFFALVPLLIATRHADHAQVMLAWVYVLLRAAHSVVHIRGKNVRLRFLLFVASCAVLSAMWIGFFVDMVAAANAYGAAMDGLVAQP